MSVVLLDNRILPLLASNEAFWLWSLDAQKLILTNQSGASLMGASGVSIAIERSYSPSHRFASQIAKVLPRLGDEPRLERINVHSRFVSSAQIFEVSRVTFEDKSQAILLKSPLEEIDLAALIHFVENNSLPILAFNLEGKTIGSSDKAVSLSKENLKSLLGSQAKDALLELEAQSQTIVHLVTGTMTLALLPNCDAILAILSDVPAKKTVLTAKPRLAISAEPTSEIVFIEDTPPQKYDIVEISEFSNDDVTITGTVPAPLSPPRLDTSRKTRFVWQTDASHKFVSVSHEFQETVGAKQADVIGKTFDECVETFALEADSALSEAFKRRDTWSGYAVKWPIEGANAKAIIDFAALPVFDRVRGFIGFRGFGIIKDYEGAISATQSQAENALKARVEAVVEQVKAHIPPTTYTPPALSTQEVKAFGEIGKVLKPQLVEAPKLSKSQLSDLTLLDSLPVGVIIYHGNRLFHINSTLLDMSGFESRESLERVGGMSRLFANTQLEEGAAPLAITCKDGSLKNITARLVTTKWQEESALALILSETIATLAPVTSLENALSESLNEAQLLLEKACDGFIIIDQEAQINHLNKGAQALFMKDELSLGKAALTLFAPECHRIVNDYLASVHGVGVPSLLDEGKEVLTATNTPRPLLMKIVKLTRQDGDYAAMIFKDLTTWRNAEQELKASHLKAEELSQQKSDFLARVSHEIRTPLNAILGFSEVMREEHFGPIGNERYKDYMQDIHTSGTHVLSLINDLLDLAKVESGKLELEFVELDLNSTLNETLVLLQEEARRARVVVRTSFDRALPKLLADKRSIRQIVMNIVGNSLKFTPAGGQIVLSTSINSENNLLLKIRDTGVGMSEEGLKEALEPFKQTGIKGEKNGTGLGLPLTKALIEANNASFAISSRPAQGTLVEITFPQQRLL